MLSSVDKLMVRLLTPKDPDDEVVIFCRLNKISELPEE